MKYTFYFLTTTIFLLSCRTTRTMSPNNKVSSMEPDSIIYRRAMADAAYPQPSEIDSNLIDINEQNPNLIWKTIDNEKYLLVVTWKEDAKYYRNLPDSLYNTGTRPIWISTAPELKTRFKQFNTTDTVHRLNQLLGLIPTASYKYFVEIWVRPQDLFRACPDKEVTDKYCSTCDPANEDSEHKKWINETRLSSYYGCKLYSQYPWTGLGYTYDWNPSNYTHIGLSEFIIAAGKNVYINAIYTNSEYLK